jgi:hypothetical protein
MYIEAKGEVTIKKKKRKKKKSKMRVKSIVLRWAVSLEKNLPSNQQEITIIVELEEQTTIDYRLLHITLVS